MKHEVDFINTYTGKKFHFSNINPEEIDILDIAHSLAHKCRFCGHTKVFYSVAEHSIHMSEYLKDEKLAKMALIHDASEAYTADLPHPQKKWMPGFKMIEDYIMNHVLDKFKIPNNVRHDESIKQLDLSMGLTEALSLMKVDDELDYIKSGVKPLKIELKCWKPEIAKQIFLFRFNQLWKNS